MITDQKRTQCLSNLGFAIERFKQILCFQNCQKLSFLEIWANTLLIFTSALKVSFLALFQMLKIGNFQNF